MAFMFYIFNALDMGAKAQVVQATIAIPQKIMVVANDIRNVTQTEIENQTERRQVE